jgi:hypothetical protein
VTQVQGPVYVYGVLAACDQGAVSAIGVEGRPVRAVGGGGLAALVSDLDGGHLAAAREVRAHWRVLEEASQRTTVLPTRFGTVMESERALCEDLLGPNAPRLTALLEAVAGCVQLSVKGRYDEDRLLREAVAGSPTIGTLRERLRKLPEAAGYYDRIRLGELVAAGIARLREADTARALEQLAPLAVDVRVEEPAGADGAFALAFLVRRDGVDAFGRGVGALIKALGDRVEVRFVGPLPPYSFADAQLTAPGRGSAAWA